MSALLRSTVLLIAIFGTACDTSDKGVTVHNTDPVVRFEAPVEGSTFQVSEAIEFLASVQDNESDATELELEWTSDLDGLLEDGTTPSADGAATFVTAGLSEGLHTVTLKATDPRGLIGSDYMTVKVETDCLALTACDYDEDGYTEEQGDCDDNDDTRHPDADEIENGIDDDCDDLVDEGTQRYDDDGDGYTELEGDCNDDNADISPVAEEIADGVDQDCDDVIDEGTEVFDDDGDGFSEEDGDCNDDNSAVHPEAMEVANGVDDDCDGVIDEGSDAFDDDGDGYTELAGDCDDDDPLVSPVGIEVCGDEIDNDCDSYVDDEDDDTDEDGDGFSACEGPEQDCDDDDEDVHPEADEVCGDEIDNDCDGDIDADDSDTDADDDGYSACAGDCDDTRDDVFPGGTEVCDAAGLVDEDCDGTINEIGAVGSDTYYMDGDDDGYGGVSTVEACAMPSGYTATSTDCDDGNPSINPGATEVCDGADNDCDGDTDEASAADVLTWYFDGDGDGYGSTIFMACSAPSSSYVSASGDCDDGDSSSYPGAPETCDGDDNDCDGATDEAGAIGETTWYYDGDGDGFPGSAVSVSACEAPADHLPAPGVWDCDDSDYYRNPDVEEVCDGVDWDCDGSDTEIDAVGCVDYHRDADWDGYGVDDDYLCLCSASGEYRISTYDLEEDGEDCCDTEWGAKPGSSTWSTRRTDCGTWDWNCDDDIDARWDSYGICGGYPACDEWPFVEGWRGYIPICGSSGTWLDDCDNEFDFFDSYCSTDTVSKTQQCR